MKRNDISVGEFLLGICFRLLCLSVMYRNGTKVGVAKSRVVGAAYQRGLSHRPATLGMSHRGLTEFSLDRVAYGIQSPHGDVRGKGIGGDAVLKEINT
jgi:hypothetical protein